MTGNIIEKINTQLKFDEEKLLVALNLADKIALKKYVGHLRELDVKALDLKKYPVNKVKLFKITQMVYSKDEFSLHKFSSVYNTLASADVSIFLLLQSDGSTTDFYLGVRNFDKTKSVANLKTILEDALKGQFPGTKVDTTCIDEIEEVEALMKNVGDRSLSIVTSVADSRSADITDNSSYVQGLEKFVETMRGKKYTGIIMANAVNMERLAQVRAQYEALYTNLVPYSKIQFSQSRNESINSTSTYGETTTEGKSDSITTGATYSTSKEKNMLSKGLKAIAGAGGVAGALGGALGFAAMGPIGFGVAACAGALGMALSETESKGTNDSRVSGTNTSFARSNSTSEGTSTGSSNSINYNAENKTVIGMLERIDSQLKRIRECESLGMWECAAYFISPDNNVAEIAAANYKSLMRGENSGVELSAINTWYKNDSNSNLKKIRQYIVNFANPVFEYGELDVTPCTMISGRELAIHMNLPKKSVKGLPVIEYADFGREVITPYGTKRTESILIGDIYNKGIVDEQERVRINKQSLTMHTFITGSTGSGKSNIVYSILSQCEKLNTKFLVIEPAKGEYKNLFCNKANVYGTNPKKTPLLKINPFKFPEDMHVLEHIDRLIEIFNVCWPMYAAMPALLKEAVEKAYQKLGWDLDASFCTKGEVYPNFADLLETLDDVIGKSEYSAEVKSNYQGALLTRVRSLTNGLNGQIFTDQSLGYEELFDENVVVDISRVGSIETKALIMGILVMQLQEYRMSNSGMNETLKHITVLEEAHNLLKRTSVESTGDGGGLVGKSVEMITNAIAEMRTYGEGFVIVDQSPELLDQAVIKNTNTKIILRLPDYEDRVLCGRSAGLNDAQIEELAKLPTGVAAVYQNNWLEPVLCQAREHKCECTQYLNDNELKAAPLDEYKRSILKALLHECIGYNYKYDLEEVDSKVDLLPMSNYKKLCIKQALRAKDKKTIANLKEAVRYLVATQNISKEVAYNENVAEWNAKLIKQLNFDFGDLSQEYILVTLQCVLREEIREGEYLKKWYSLVRGAKNDERV